MAPKEKKPPQVFDVPAGTPSSECKGCKATIYWIVTEGGNRMPVDCDAEGGVRPHRISLVLGGTEKVGGCGVSHFATCPMAGAFRRAR